jgi:hypothetical protein
VTLLWAYVNPDAATSNAALHLIFMTIKSPFLWRNACF